MFNKDTSILDILSNSSLDKLLNSLSWTWSESGNKGIEIISLKELESKSILATFFLIQIIYNNRNIGIGEYNYRILGSSITRSSPKIRKPDQNQLSYTIKRIISWYRAHYVIARLKRDASELVYCLTFTNVRHA